MFNTTKEEEMRDMVKSTLFLCINQKGDILSIVTNGRISKSVLRKCVNLTTNAAQASHEFLRTAFTNISNKRIELKSENMSTSKSDEEK